jgi:hypothetical protein
VSGRSVVGYRTRRVPLLLQVRRMPLAKHEIAGTGKGPFAEAPGYGGLSKLTGSVYRQIVLTDDAADKFMNIKFIYEEAEEEEASLNLTSPGP